MAKKKKEYIIEGAQLTGAFKVDVYGYKKGYNEPFVLDCFVYDDGDAVNGAPIQLSDINEPEPATNNEQALQAWAVNLIKKKYIIKQ